MWLDDEIINFYFARLMDRAASNPNLPTIRCFTLQFFDSLNRENWASKDKVFDKDIVLSGFLPSDQNRRLL
jgi:Ulp1 family protease